MMWYDVREVFFPDGVKRMSGTDREARSAIEKKMKEGYARLKRDVEFVISHEITDEDRLGNLLMDLVIWGRPELVEESGLLKRLYRYVVKFNPKLANDDLFIYWVFHVRRCKGKGSA